PPSSLAGETEAHVDLAIRGDLYEEPQAEEQGGPPRQAWFRIAPDFSVRLSERAVFTFRPVLEADTHGEISRRHLFDEEDRELVRSPLRFESLSIKLDLGHLDLELGRQKLAWGRTDGVNPTDNLTPRDWTDPLDEQRLSPWALRAN